MRKLIDANGHHVPGWMARMLSDGDRAVARPEDTFWADMRARTTILAADLKQLEEDADDLLIDITRAQMAGER